MGEPDNNNTDDDDEFGEKAMYQKVSVPSKRPSGPVGTLSTTSSSVIDEDEVFDSNQQQHVVISNHADVIHKPASTSSLKEGENREIVTRMSFSAAESSGGGGGGGGGETDRKVDQDRGGEGDGITSISYEQSLMMPSIATDDEQMSHHASSRGNDTIAVAGAGASTAADIAESVVAVAAVDTSDYKDDDFEKEDEES